MSKVFLLLTLTLALELASPISLMALTVNSPAELLEAELIIRESHPLGSFWPETILNFESLVTSWSFLNHFTSGGGAQVILTLRMTWNQTNERKIRQIFYFFIFLDENSADFLCSAGRASRYGRATIYNSCQLISWVYGFGSWLSPRTSLAESLKSILSAQNRLQNIFKSFIEICA